MYENEYGTPEGPEERAYRESQQAEDLRRNMEPERAHLRAFGLPADRHHYAAGVEADRHVWLINLRRPETLAVVEAAGFEVFQEDTSQRVGYIRRKPGPLVPRPAPSFKPSLDLSDLEKRLNAASFVLGGSRVWDGGRLSLPTSDVDVFISMTREDLDVFTTTPCAAREWWFKRSASCARWRTLALRKGSGRSRLRQSCKTRSTMRVGRATGRALATTRA